MKEWIILFNSELWPFLKRKRKTELKNLYHTFWFAFIYKKKESESLFIIHLALYQKREKSDSPSLLFKKKTKREICLLKRAKERLALFCQKTSDSHEKPKSEFWTLIFRVQQSHIYSNTTVLYSIVSNDATMFHCMVLLDTA